MAALSVFYQNVRGLRTKTNTFLKNVSSETYDLICVSESWLLPGIFDSELVDSRYSVYRTDRDYVGRNMSLGGGTLVAARRALAADSRDVRAPPAMPDADITCVNIRISEPPLNNLLRIYCCYFPHNADQVNSELAFFEFISDFFIECPDDKFLIIGDFNITNGKWHPAPQSCNCYVLENPSEDSLTYNISTFLSFTNFTQHNFLLNHYNRMLDLVVSNMSCSVEGAEGLVPADAHHPPLRARVLAAPAPPALPPAPRTVRRFHAADYNIINTALASVNWEQHLSVDCIEVAVDNFYTVVNDIIHRFIPSRVVRNEMKYPRWYSKPLISLINKKNKIHKKWKIYNRLSDYENYSSLRRMQKKLEKDCFNAFISNAEDNIKINSKHFWSYIKSRKSINEIPDTIYFGESSIGLDGQSIANIFNTFFHSVFEKDQIADNIPDNKNYLNNTTILCSVDISIDLVEKYLKMLDTSKGCGPDGLHPLFLQRCHRQLSTPITVLFRMSLDTCVVPVKWKQSLVTPIYKGGGDKHNVCNYRGISKLNVIPKLFEKIIYDVMFPSVRPYLINSQHGFINRKSTESNLCEYIDSVLNALDEGFQVDAVYTDYSKAFDKISHNLLVKKLDLFGIHGNLLRWLVSYLKNRSQAVSIKGYTSSFIPISSGVPQGSHLGPLLFNIFINDVTNILNNSDSLLYADDTKIFIKVKSIEDCHNLQSDLNNLLNYCELNKISLNIDKCCVISFTRKRNHILYDYNFNHKSLRRVTEVRDLGVHLDSELSFRKHFDIITAKAYKMLGFIFRQSKDFKQPNTLILLFNSFVRSVLEYASTVWNPQYLNHIYNIERIQNKFIKRLKYKFKFFDTSCFLSLENRREMRDQMFLYKIINHYVDSPYLLSRIYLYCKYNSRHQKAFVIQNCSRNYTKNRFVIRACENYNKLHKQADLFHEKPLCYKKKIMSTYLKN